MAAPAETGDQETVVIVPATMEDFVRESNRIEGIFKDGAEFQSDVDAHETLLSIPAPLRVRDVEEFVHAVAPGHMLRTRKGMDVRVGNYVAPPGGRDIKSSLSALIEHVDLPYIDMSPWQIHCDYETLHPFTDGNGRSGRVLWLRAMGGIRRAPLNFLHTFYYQSLENYNQRK